MLSLMRRTGRLVSLDPTSFPPLSSFSKLTTLLDADYPEHIEGHAVVDESHLTQANRK